jgi:hypothetical protein
MDFFRQQRFNSVLAKTSTYIDIILLHDCSTDDSEVILLKLSQHNKTKSHKRNAEDTRVFIAIPHAFANEITPHGRMIWDEPFYGSVVPEKKSVDVKLSRLGKNTTLIFPTDDSERALACSTHSAKAPR